jgi:ribosomal RNA-processing protein 36
LRKAQRQLALATVASDEEDSAAEDDNDDDAPEAAAVSRAAPAKGKEKEWSTKPRSDIAKRAHKHA